MMNHWTVFIMLYSQDVTRKSSSTSGLKKDLRKFVELLVLFKLMVGIFIVIILWFHVIRQDWTA